MYTSEYTFDSHDYYPADDPVCGFWTPLYYSENRLIPLSSNLFEDHHPFKNFEIMPLYWTALKDKNSLILYAIATGLISFQI